MLLRQVSGLSEILKYEFSDPRTCKKFSLSDLASRVTVTVQLQQKLQSEIVRWKEVIE
jgi:hypothetical protein